MTDIDLDAIYARLDVATPGPWGLTDDHTIVRGPKVIKPGYYTCVSPVAKVADVDDRVMWDTGQADFILVDPADDADFITHARQDMETLLAEVERLRALLDDVLALREGRAS